MKRIDLLTVTVSSATLLAFCLCSFLLLWHYSKIRDDIDLRNANEIAQIKQSIEQLDNNEKIDRVALAEQLESNLSVIKGHQNEWFLLQQILQSFVYILAVIVLSHLVFVHTAVKSSLPKDP